MQRERGKPIQRKTSQVFEVASARCDYVQFEITFDEDQHGEKRCVWKKMETRVCCDFEMEKKMRKFSRRVTSHRIIAYDISRARLLPLKIQYIVNLSKRIIKLHVE